MTAQLQEDCEAQDMLGATVSDLAARLTASTRFGGGQVCVYPPPPRLPARTPPRHCAGGCLLKSRPRAEFLVTTVPDSALQQQCPDTFIVPCLKVICFVSPPPASSLRKSAPSPRTSCATHPSRLPLSLQTLEAGKLDFVGIISSKPKLSTQVAWTCPEHSSCPEL